VVSACFARGKHVLLEKPFTVEAAHAEMLAAEAERRGLVLAFVHNLLFSRGITRLRALSDRGALGDLLGFHVLQTSTAERLTPPWRDDLPFGLFFDESPHPLYLLRSLGGAITVHGGMVSPSTIGRNTPAAVTVHLDVGGRPATLYSGFEASLSEWHVIVYGARALAAFDIFRDILVVTPHDGRHTAGQILRTTLGIGRTHLGGVISSGWRHLSGRLLYGNAENFRRFVAAVRSGVAPDAISAADGLAIARLQHELMAKLVVVG
jgi:predicted dehydrogenase